jgi:asparagine synthase (glutamine-hydrolysing)
MCGIAGAVGLVDEAVRAALRRTHDRQAHRGPDADGLWFESDAGQGAAASVAFAHRRLAIIDLSEHGRQPMADPRTGNVVCFNGEIYNFRELRPELEAAGCRFRSECDTEVLLHAYAVWGPACVTRLRGMFAFALWDAQRREVFLARDRVGIKPLYLTELVRGTERTVLFASELRALLASGLVEARLAPGALATYLWNGFVIGPDSLIQGVRELPRGCTLRLAADGRVLEERRYWRFPPPAAGTGTAAEVERALEDAVRLRLVSDVPLAVFLSGGIDSSAVTALAARVGTSKIRTFNLAFDESEYDESEHARRVARAVGTQHDEVHLSPARFREQLEPALASLDQPTVDGINTYFVSRAVREAGITVALAGTGGDELFGGYRTFAEVPRAARWARRLAPLPEPLRAGMARALTRLLSGRAGEVPPQTRWGKAADVLGTAGCLTDAYQVSYALFSRSFLGELSRSRAPAAAPWGLPPARRAALVAETQGLGELEAVSHLEMNCFLAERLLRDTDSTSMAVALEVRVPLIDHHVIESAARLPSEARYRPLGRKQLLRAAALRDLDPALFERPKTGFVLPLEPWIQDAARAEVDAAFASRAQCEAVGLCPDTVGRLWRAYQAGAPGLYWSRVWSLFTLLHWTRAQGASL